MNHFTGTGYAIFQKVNEGGYGATTKFLGIFNKQSVADTHRENLEKKFKNEFPHRYCNIFVLPVPVGAVCEAVLSEVYE